MRLWILGLILITTALMMFIIINSINQSLFYFLIIEITLLTICGILAFKYKNKKTYLIIILLLALLISRAMPLIRGQITNIESLATIASIKEIALNYKIFFTESHIQSEMILIPFHLFLNKISILNIVYIIKAILVLISGISVYSYTKLMTNNKNAGLLSILFLIISPLAIYSESLGSWTGDVIAPVFLLMSVLALLFSFNNKNLLSKWGWLGFSVIMLAISYLSWNGGIYALIIYILVGISLLLSYVFSIKKILIIIISIIGICLLIYIQSPANIGVFSQSNYQGGILITLGQFISGTSYTLYGNGAITNPNGIPILTQTPIYYIYIIISTLLSSLLIVLTTWFFLKKERITIIQKQVFLSIMCIYLVTAPIALSYVRFDSLTILPIAILAGSALSTLKTKIKPILIVIFTLMILVMLFVDILQIGITPYPTQLTQTYTTASLWIANNTKANATFLTDPFDETPIQFYGNKESYLDGFQDIIWYHPESLQNKTSSFINFLYQKSCNLTYFQANKPNYLVLNYWLLYPNYISNQSINETNLQYLSETSSNVNCSNINLDLVYNKNGTKIFKVG